MNINNPPPGLIPRLTWCVQGIQALWKRLNGTSSGGGGSANMKIGNVVEDGHARDILFVDAGGNLAQNDQFYYYGTGINIGNVSTDDAYLQFDRTTGVYSTGDIGKQNNGTFYKIDDANKLFVESTGSGASVGISRDYNTLAQVWTRLEQDKSGTYALTSDLGATTSIDLTGRNAAINDLLSYTPAGNGTYRVGGYVTITAVATDVLGFQVAWTDPSSNTHTRSFYPLGVSATVPNMATARDYQFSTMDIRVKAATAILMTTTLLTGGGTITYDVGANISVINTI